MQARGTTALVSINAQVLDDLCRYGNVMSIVSLILVSTLTLRCSRFLINLPDDEKKDPVKLFTHLELAHWFYLDLLRPEDHTLPACNFKEFITANILFSYKSYVNLFSH